MPDTPRKLALRHVIAGRQRILAAQREHMKGLIVQRRDTRAAQSLLLQYERSLAAYEDELRRLEREGEAG